ncbi:MAG: branched-chain amino acid aminotransferase [Planctomycetes bacterium]|nr:branched-chain amino acid aminotransferase [Planctomycetota bacterium]
MAVSGFSFVQAGKLFVADGHAARNPIWSAGKLEEVRDFALHPSAAVLNYGVSCFEGQKAFYQQDGGIAIFRIERNAERLRHSAETLEIPPVPAATFVRACVEVTRSCRAQIPAPGQGALYLRPLLFGVEPILGVAAGKSFRFHVFGSPVGNYFQDSAGGKIEGLRLRVPESARAAPGGLGHAKCSANYAATLKARREVQAAGDHEALYLDAATRSLVEETAGSNVFAVLRSGTLVTPALSGTILAGITRESILAIAREDLRLRVEERALPFAEVLSEAEEFFACGTAVAVAPVAQIHARGNTHKLPKPSGAVALELRRRLLDVQNGKTPDTRGWLTRVE